MKFRRRTLISAVLSGSGDVAAPPPVAAFVSDRQDASAQFAVQFTDQSTGNPTSWHWEKSNNGGDTWSDFSGSPTDQNPSEEFNAGTWSIRLTATNDSGSNSSTRVDYIVVSNNALVWVTGGDAENTPGQISKSGDEEPFLITMNSINRRGENVRALMLSMFSDGHFFVAYRETDPENEFWQGSIDTDGVIDGEAFVTCAIAGFSEGEIPVGNDEEFAVEVAAP